jgi:hypothetical protein
MPHRRARHLCAFLLLLALAALSLSAEDHTAPLDIRHNMPFVQVMVNGKGPFTFSIDTGTGGQALVSPALIQQLNLPVTGEVEVGDPSGLNPQKVKVVGIKSLNVAGVEFKDVQASQHQPSPREGQCDGILGFVLFRDYLFTLDYPQKQLTLAHGNLAPDGGKTVIPFTMPNDVPVIELTVSGQTIDAHLDSRGFGLSFPEKFCCRTEVRLRAGRARTRSHGFQRIRDQGRATGRRRPPGQLQLSAALRRDESCPAAGQLRRYPLAKLRGYVRPERPASTPSCRREIHRDSGPADEARRRPRDSSVPLAPPIPRNLCM